MARTPLRRVWPLKLRSATPFCFRVRFLSFAFLCLVGLFFPRFSLARFVLDDTPCATRNWRLGWLYWDGVVIECGKL